MPVPTAEMRAEAEKGLAWRREYGRGGTLVGVARARDIAAGRNLSMDTVARMASYFARHAIDADAPGWSPGEPGFPSPGRIAWALWGGDPGRTWARQQLAQDTPPGGRSMFSRSFEVADLTIRSDGDGRTVEALAAVYDTPASVRDAQGEYDEVIRPGAFRDAIAGDNWRRVQVLYNHGLDAFGRSSDRFAMPIGTPLEIREDTRGLVTVTRYARTDLADEVLALIRDGAIRGQSFRGQWLRSTPASGFFRPGRGGSRQLVERHDVSLLEYGPTPFPVYTAAAIVGVRSLAEILDELSEEERSELRRILGEGTPTTPDLDEVTVATDQPAEPDNGPADNAEAATPLDVLAAAVQVRKRRQG